MRERNYILRGKLPVLETNVIEWAKWFETADRIVAKTQVGKVEVSTVFLGTDHNYSGKGEPILFETMVFGVELDQEENRYETWRQAEEGHKYVVGLVKLAEGNS